MPPTGVWTVAPAPVLLPLPLAPLPAAVVGAYSPWYDCADRDVEPVRTIVAVVAGRGKELWLRRGRLRGKKRVYGKVGVEGRIAEGASRLTPLLCLLACGPWRDGVEEE